jgi:hypothetical protein
MKYLLLILLSASMFGAESLAAIDKAIQEAKVKAQVDGYDKIEKYIQELKPIPLPPENADSVSITKRRAYLYSYNVGVQTLKDSLLRVGKPTNDEERKRLRELKSAVFPRLFETSTNLSDMIKDEKK